MQAERLKLSVRGVRAVENADIVIGDITVLSGVNASGKSTLAHLVHSLVNLSREYERFARDNAWNELARVSYHVRRFKERIDIAVSRHLMEKGIYFEKAATRVRQNFDDDIRTRGDILQVNWQDLLSDYRVLEGENEEEARRYYNSFVSSLFQPDLFKPFEEPVPVDKFDVWIEKKVEEAERIYKEKLENRSTEVWNMAKPEATRWLQYAGEIKLYEGAEKVYDSTEKKGSISEILNVEHAFYIESPWRNLPSQVDVNMFSIQDGFDFSIADNSFIPDKSFFSVIGGNVVESKEDEFRATYIGGRYGNRRMVTAKKWQFERSDGKGAYPLEECATGIKAFSVLNFLYTRGLLNNRSLLIVDEPESHLHPQWILEYAKILVKLNKNLGVRLLLATHSPDMLNAIRRVANVDEVPDLRFYLAYEIVADGPQKYKFESLGRNVEPIFSAFNLAMDKTEAYPLELK